MRVLGIDLGTGSTKAAVVDDRGHVRGLGVAQHHIDRPEAGAAEIAPDAWLASASAATRDAMAAAGGGPLTAAGLSGQMPGGGRTGAAGLPLRPPLPWPRGPAAPTLVALLAYTVDLANHSHLVIRSLLGPSPRSGSRFYGLGNELEIALTIVLLVALAAVLRNRVAALPPGGMEIVDVRDLATVHAAVMVRGGGARRG